MELAWSRAGARAPLLALLFSSAGFADLLFLSDLNGGGDCVPCTFTAANKLTTPMGDLLKVAQLGAPNAALDDSAMLIMNSMRGAGLNDVTTMIMNAFMAAGRPVNVVLVGHGGAGQLQLGGTDILNAANEAAFANATRGKLGMLTLFGCCVASGTGPTFLQQLANDTRAQVKAYAGTIGVAKGDATVMDGFYVAGGNGALVTLNPIPEPATFWVGCSALILATVIQRLRRKS